MRLLVRLGPYYRGGARQEATRGADGHHVQFGFRASPGGGPSTDAREWSRGAVERYHDVGPGYAAVARTAGEAAYLERAKVFQEAWRACCEGLLAALMAHLEHEVGAVLLAFQTAMALQPGLSEVVLRQGVPFQQMQASRNAHVNVHRDKYDLLGATIVWLCFLNGTSSWATAPAGAAGVAPAAGGGSAAAAAPAAAGGPSGEERPPPGKAGVFVIFNLGICFDVTHLSSVYLRSDLHWHGTVLSKDLGPRDVVFGAALANTKPVTAGVLKVLHRKQAGTRTGRVTWRRRYDADPPDNVYIRK